MVAYVRDDRALQKATAVGKGPFSKLLDNARDLHAITNAID